MIDITGHLAVHFTVNCSMEGLLFFFLAVVSLFFPVFLQLNSHIQTPHLPFTKKNEKQLKIQISPHTHNQSGRQ